MEKYFLTVGVLDKWISSQIRMVSFEILHQNKMFLLLCNKFQKVNLFIANDKTHNIKVNHQNKVFMSLYKVGGMFLYLLYRGYCLLSAYMYI